ncbi:MAG: thioredoxin family protein [Chloroflexota bacterium]|nr:thioredoxin family protein [Dehalococcoidia bacterium]MDW8252625.1 thioredoxin family protein [Chloroflexota bacterium]
MTVTPERFAQGMTYEEFKAQMTRNRERLEQNEAGVQIAAEDLEAFKRLPKPLNVLVLAEDWCGDVIDNLPILGRLARESGKLNLRIFLRDQNLDLMDQWLYQGKFRSIPTFVFFDEAFNQVGLFIERPASATARRRQFREELYRKNPEFGPPDRSIAELPEEIRVKLMQEMANAREQWRDLDNRDVIAELRAIVEQAFAQKV